MSTTFEVYPCNHYIPTIGEIVEQTNSIIDEFLNTHNIPINYTVVYGFNGLQGPNEIDKNFELSWNQSGYIYLGYPNQFSSCFISYNESEPYRYWGTIDNEKTRIKDFERCLEIKHYWHLDGSDFTKGFAAIAIATLTGGFIYSGDGAWDHCLLPEFASKFRQLYLYPDSSVNEIYRQYLTDRIREFDVHSG